ncbi:serine protease [Streptomyces hygroscopicus]|uniref:S1 family peptidase n=1 Tax=Streptomyces hygroscopicus TaxID=1912 RepID=UPI0033CE3551
MGAEMGITADETSSGGTWRVRIRSSAGDVLGAGILLGSETVLTCAHVIPDDGLPVPATEVLVDLVEVPDAEPVPARVADGCWVPQRSDGCGDVALLRLGRPQPAEHAAPLYRLPPVLGRPVWMGGFPEGLDNGHYLRARTAGRVGPRAEWVGLDPASRRDVVRKGFSGAGVEDEATRHVIGMVVSRYDDPPGIPSAERLSVSYMIPVETILRHLPVVHRWVRGDPGVDRPLVSRLTAGVQDVGFAQRLAVWLRREPLTGRAGVVDVETVVIESGDRVRYEALSRAITLADRELSGGGPDEALSAAPHGTVPPLGSVDLAIDVTRRTDTEVALRVADRMDLRSPGDTSPLSRVRANAVPLTIVAVGVDRARDPEALVWFMKLLADRGSRLEHQGSFIRGGYPRPADADFVFSAGLLPGADRRSTAREVSGDFAAVFRDTPRARELMRYLASADAQRAWGRKTAGRSAHPFFANRDVPLDAQGDDAVDRRIATALRDSASLCLDASDAMPTRMRLAFQRAALTYLSDTTERPDGLLRSLEKVRRRLRGDPDQPWLSTVCG